MQQMFLCFHIFVMLVMLVSLRDGLVRVKHLTVFLSLSCCFQYVGRVTFGSGNARKKHTGYWLSCILVDWEVRKRKNKGIVPVRLYLLPFGFV